MVTQEISTYVTEKRPKNHHILQDNQSLLFLFPCEHHWV